jgi:hypothetical protein
MQSSKSVLCQVEARPVYRIVSRVLSIRTRGRKMVLYDARATIYVFILYLEVKASAVPVCRVAHKSNIVKVMFLAATA